MIREQKSGLIGLAFKWLLIAFNVIMVLWLLRFIGVAHEVSGKAQSVDEVVVTRLATIGVALYWIVFWIVGDIILGLATFVTRAKKQKPPL